MDDFAEACRIATGCGLFPEIDFVDLFPRDPQALDDARGRRVRSS